MANINETIANVEKLDPELARQIKKYVHDHSYGLVFEHNLPEAVRLYTKTAAVGDTVNIRPERGKDETDENKVAWNAKAVKDGMATIENGEEEREVAVQDLVPIVSYRDVIYPGLKEVDRVERGGKDDPYQVVINAENYHALEMLAYCYAGKVDCIYIDPPYNTGAKDWKYNNDYVDGNDQYRHSKWLAFMERRLKLAKKLLNPEDSVLIVTIDEKEYLRLGMLLEQMFPEARIQMVSSVINPAGAGRTYEFSRTDEYIYIAQFGNSTVTPESIEKENVPIIWDTLRRSSLANARGKHGKGACGPNQFYPIYVNDTTGRIEAIGEPVAEGVPRETAPSRKGCTAVFPVRPNNIEMNWGITPDEARDRLKKGYIRAGKHTPDAPQKYVISYVTGGNIKDIESGVAVTAGYAEDGSIIAFYPKGRDKMPTTNWNRPTHDAQRYGTNLVKTIIGDRFNYPKSLYAVCDILRFFVTNKPDALIVDFFAGSGTTLHAVNLLNAEDGGHRRCVCVTNNEVSADEQKAFIKKGFRQGDEDWEAHGIARYVTWPRTKCSIEGVDVNGNPLKGNYIGSDMPMSDGFKANAIFFDLTYESAWPIRLDNAFDAIAPILWMQAGARGPIIKRVGKSYLITDYYGVLFDYGQASKFVEAIKKHPNIKTAFVVTDDQRRYSNMCRRLPGIEVHRLYETFLKTFEICGEGGLD
jgi:adenine-specific DNA-methyltransferase